MVFQDEEAETHFSAGQSNCKTFLYVFFAVLLASICCGWIKQEHTTPQAFETDVDLREIFMKLDINNDGSLTFTEFLNIVQYDLDVFKSEKEKNSLDYDIHQPSQIILLPEEEILTIQAKFKPLVISSLTKDVNDELLNKHERTVFKGIFDWKKPEKELCNFAAHHFSIFLPPKEIELQPGNIWWIVPPSLNGKTNQLSSERYQSPQLLPEYNYLYIFLSMLHKNPFLLSRFAPQGTIATIRAVSADLLDIVFRLHAEFQLNDPPYFPFWFTPSQFKGRVIMNKNCSSILYFHMEVPSDKSLNVDMEWLNGPKQSDGMEVDIGYIPELSLTSTTPSVQGEGIDVNNTFLETFPNYKDMILSLKWSQELKIEEAYSLLEKTMYPFKQVPYYNFSEAYNLASKQNKLIHAILLWGALDDQSC